MLVIRREQWDEMQNSLNLEFENRCLAELRASYPEKLKDVDEDVLRDDVRGGLGKTGRFRLKDDGFIVEFLKYTVEYGRDFPDLEETLWAREILDNGFLTEEQKMTALARHRTLEIMKD
ncbi:MAG: hypothetical protein JSS81_04085 [Acidobacteria bacterium]|nr:hypothetical protein [Acidobacteriota bacterium]